MFEASLISLLAADSDLTDRLTTYKSAPAIFADRAPKAASCEGTKSYIVFDIDRIEGGGLVVERFDIDINIFGPIVQAKVIREIVERIYFILDLSVIEDDARFEDIRFYRESGQLIYRGDSKITQYEVRFTARGVRKAWIDQL